MQGNSENEAVGSKLLCGISEMFDRVKTLSDGKETVIYDIADDSGELDRRADAFITIAKYIGANRINGQRLTELAKNEPADVIYRLARKMYDYWDCGHDECYDCYVNFLTIAAQKGVADAQYELAEFCESGLDVNWRHNLANADWEKAWMWYNTAAAQGHPGAIYFVSKCYERGDHVPRDVKKAFEMTKAAAEKELSQFYPRLGDLYFKGVGCDKDLEKAMFWYQKAGAAYGIIACHEAAGALKEAERLLLLEPGAYLNRIASAIRGESVWAGYFANPFETFENYYLSLPERSITNKMKLTALWFSENYEENESNPRSWQDNAKAFKWYKIVADSGNTKGQTALSRCFLEGIGCEKDVNKALELLRLAAPFNKTAAEKLAQYEK